MSDSPYANTLSYTEVPDVNYTYLAHTSGTPVFTDPLSGSTMGLMMLLSTLQYQSPYMSPIYATAANQAGKAAYTQVGGQNLQDKMGSKVENQVNDSLRSMGITDLEMGAVLGSAKVIKDRQLSINGPKLGFIRTHLTFTENSGTIGLKWSW